LIYPTDPSGNAHQIKADEAYSFLSQETQIIAGSKPGEENLLFVITSLNHKSYAENIKNTLSKGESEEKASTGQKGTIWGAEKLVYAVQLQ
jgi:hypothetical protein